ncbi:MAG: PD-(D/E)XK nuclease family protein [Bacteroidales bacterium]|nr:PD-(D/E)XK nuclease family protein [Bacteroidales bacterium]
MSDEKIKTSLEFYDSIMNSIDEKCKELLDFSREFYKRYLEEKRKLPYHINVIDELHINENGHSRILLKLLQFENDRGEWEVLQSLVNYIKTRNKSKQFDRIDIVKPEITQEKARIDLWVRDRVGNYAIIFENKIYDANDQEAQLSRYIDKTKECHFDENNIFVVYLSQIGNEPNKQSWGEYKQSFKDRYINLSFKEDILPWLKNSVLPNIKYKDTYLINAVQQYIDYLDGLFDLRTIQKTINMKLNRIIADYLHLEECKDDKECFEKTREQLNNINELQRTVQTMFDEIGFTIMRKTEMDIIEKYPSIRKDKNESENNVRIVVPFDGKDVLVIIDWDSSYHSTLYCQVEYLNGEQLLETDLLTERTKDILNNKPNEKQRWVYVNTVDNQYDYIGVSEIFRSVVERLV